MNETNGLKRVRGRMPVASMPCAFSIPRVTDHTIICVFYVFFFALFPRFVEAQTSPPQDPYETAQAIAAEVSRLTGSSETLQDQLINPMMSATPMSPFNPDRAVEEGMQASFNPQVAEKGTREYLRIQLQGPGMFFGGDIDVRVSLNVTALSATAQEPQWVQSMFRGVSGITVYGFIQCDRRTWNNCTYYQWSTDESGRVTAEPGGSESTAGGYCINTSCGFQMTTANIKRILGDIGSGIHVAIQSKDPSIVLSDVEIRGTTATYYAQDVLNIDTEYDPASYGSQNPHGYYDPQSSWALEEAAEQERFRQASDPASPYSLVLEAENAAHGGIQEHTCQVVRHVEVRDLDMIDVIEPVSGNGIIQPCGENCMDVMFGQVGDNYWAGYCTIYEMDQVFSVKRPENIGSAILAQAIWDDYIQVYVQGQKVYAGPNDNFPPETGGACELATSWNVNPNVNITQLFQTEGNIDVKVRVSVTGNGEGYTRTRIQLQYMCEEATTQETDRILNHCTELEQDQDCVLIEESVDGVRTVMDGVRTGENPFPAGRLFEAPCPVNVTRSWWEKTRLYSCRGENSGFDLTTAKDRLAIIKPSTGYEGESLYYEDQRRDPDGTPIEESISRELNLDLPEQETCIKSCKVREWVEDTDAGTQEQVDSYHTGNYRDTHTYIYRYPKCINNTCPLEEGQEIVKDCQCLNEFVEATLVLQTMNAASKDMICSYE